LLEVYGVAGLRWGDHEAIRVVACPWDASEGEQRLAAIVDEMRAEAVASLRREHAAHFDDEASA
jgi:hypothetical protein